MKPDHPDMLSLQAQIDELEQADRAAKRRKCRPGATTRLLAEYRAALVGRARRSRRGSSALKGDVLNLRGRSIQYNILQREVDTNRSLYDALLQRYKEIGVAGGVGMAPVSIVDRADAPGAAVQAEPVPQPAVRPRPGPARRDRRRRSGSNSSTTRSRPARTSATSSACLPRRRSQDRGEGHVRRGSEEPDVDRFGGLFGDRRGASLQHRSRNAQGPAGHQHALGRGQVVDRAGARAEFRAARASRCC